MSKKAKKLPTAIKKIPVRLEVVRQSIEPQVQLPYPQAASFVPEQQFTRPLVCGLQVQNVDDDDRQRLAGQLAPNLIGIGSLGCFVTLATGATAFLSNNHVLAGENRGLKGHDRILQPGNLAFDPNQHYATLTDFIPLKPSPNNARPARGNVVFNEVDAAVAVLRSRAPVHPRFPPHPPITRAAQRHRVHGRRPRF